MHVLFTDKNDFAAHREGKTILRKHPRNHFIKSENLPTIRLTKSVLNVRICRFRHLSWFCYINSLGSHLDKCTHIHILEWTCKLRYCFLKILKYFDYFYVWVFCPPVCLNNMSVVPSEVRRGHTGTDTHLDRTPTPEAHNNNN